MIMEKFMKRSAAFLCLAAALGAAAVSVFVKPARVHDETKPNRYIYSFGGKKKGGVSGAMVTNVKPGQAVKMAAKNFFKK